MNPRKQYKSQTQPHNLTAVMKKKKKTHTAKQNWKNPIPLSYHNSKRSQVFQLFQIEREGEESAFLLLSAARANALSEAFAHLL